MMRKRLPLIVPANVGIIKRSPNLEKAKRFVSTLLSEEGQLLLFKFDPSTPHFPLDYSGHCLYGEKTSLYLF